MIKIGNWLTRFDFWTFISGPCRPPVPTSQDSWQIVQKNKRKELREYRNGHYLGKVISG